ncbi:MAG: CobW family GTP-binding protein, partial [Acidiferrobacterales bacterium]
MKVNLLFGFLGSGKTTLVRHILAERGKQDSLAVIVNEFGEVGIDGAILEGRNVDVVELTSGCLCCTLKGSLLNAIEELQQEASVEQIIVEATGVAQPTEMLETLSDPTFHSDIDLGPLVTVVNTPKFSVLRNGLGEFYGEQIANADVLLLNKVDLAEPEQLEAVREELRTLNPKATILFAEQCAVDLDFVLDGNSSGLSTRHATTHAGGTPDTHDHDHAHTAKIDSFVLNADGEAERSAVEKFFACLPENVWRAKGFMTIDAQPSLV